MISIVLSGALALGASIAPPPAVQAAAEAVLEEFCFTCHNQTSRTAGLALDEIGLDRVDQHPETWEKVVRKIRAGLMPPSGARRPEHAVLDELAGYVEGELDRAYRDHPYPGAPALHRLNRTEYGNVIRDLLDLDVDPTELLPPDNSTLGFDNVADALSVSSALVERYLSAASKVSRMAVGDVETAIVQATYPAPIDRTQDRHIEGLPFGTRGGMNVEHHFPADGTYRMQVTFLRDYNGVLFGGNTTGEQLEVSIDGERVRVIDIDAEVQKVGFEEIPPIEFEVDVSAGPHAVGLAFVQQSYGPVEDVFQPFVRSTVSLTVTKEWTVLPHVGSLTVIGPYDVTGVTETPSRRRIFECRPTSASEERPCAIRILRTLATRAFRRPATDADLDAILPFFDDGNQKDGFDGGIEMALRRILASPEFIFRFEQEGPASGEPVAISDLELASRLSFFLWSSIPDDELIEVAAREGLRDPEVLERQVRRMLADPRAQSLVENFAGQWLYLRNLDSITPSLDEFPNFDDNLRQAFRRETELFFASIVGEDRSVVDLLTADYTFVNERLARHYGIDGISGSHFRRVSLGDTPRRGLLGHGSVLMATSYATRTSPVLRGKWVLENLLGTPPPEPPPNVPALEETTRTAVAMGPVPTLRERLEAHRSNPACASCHRMMDPIGFALENFDAVGGWRDKDGRLPIDASGQLADGSPLDGPDSLRVALLGYSEQFVRTVTEKLLIYALGRGVDYRDMPVVREIVRQAASDDFRFSSLVMGVVSSRPFQWRSSNESTGPGSATLAEGGR